MTLHHLLQVYAKQNMSETEARTTFQAKDHRVEQHLPSSNTIWDLAPEKNIAFVKCSHQVQPSYEIQKDSTVYG